MHLKILSKELPRIIFYSLTFICLTILTQIGGFVMLLSLFLYRYVRSGITFPAIRFLLSPLLFAFLYLIFTFLIVPVLATSLGRVALPVSNSGQLRPLNRLTCLLNRHYVRPELLHTAKDVAAKMQERFPGTIVNYLDAGFPFINGFPLFPHLSHNDGKKLDLSFYYISKESKRMVNTSPSFIGYGVCEEPKDGEVNTPSDCNEKGYWQYSFLTKVVSQKKKDYFLFDEERTRLLTLLFIESPGIGKVFIEPHLEQRLNLNSGKIRFHGCRAVRHDDHLHVQLK